MEHDTLIEVSYELTKDGQLLLLEAGVKKPKTIQRVSVVFGDFVNAVGKEARFRGILGDDEQSYIEEVLRKRVLFLTDGSPSLRLQEFQTGEGGVFAGKKVCSGESPEQIAVDLVVKHLACLDAKEAADDEMNTWVDLHGSARLKRMKKEGMRLKSVYTVERQALELPAGWVWARTLQGEAQEALAPCDEHFTMLDIARRDKPDAYLVSWLYHNGNRQVVVVAKDRDREVVFGTK